MEEATLLFRHLPAELSTQERKSLLHHLGATRVQVMTKAGSMKNTAFAVFPNKEEATKIVKQLHQVEFLGSKLRVEFAHKVAPRVSSVIDNEGADKKDDSAESGTTKKDEEPINVPKTETVKFDDTFKTWGLQHPRRPDLCYLYPPPTQTTLTNIVHALAAVPKFYVQVLHLMNKMDLPAPFGPLTSAPPVRSDIRGYTVVDDRDQREMEISSETESELSSDGEGKEKRPKQEDQQAKHSRVSNPKRAQKRKRPRLSDLQDAMIPHVVRQAGDATLADSATLVSDVFDQATPSNRTIKLNLPSKILTQQQMSAQKSLVPPPLPLTVPQTDIKTPVQSGISTTQQTLDLPANMVPPPLPYSLTTQYPDHPHNHPGVSHTDVYPEQATSAPTHQSLGVDQSDVDTSYNVPLPPPPVTVYTNYSAPTTESVETGGFGTLHPQPKPAVSGSSDEEDPSKEWSRTKFISSSQLKRSRLSHSEMKDCSVFRRYNEGEPSCRLYIKNLAKQVTEEDIHWIFGRYIDWESEIEKNIFDIRLMKEGRMKGQAFVTLPSEKVAVSALKDTNAFVLNDKPMVVQFARSAKAQEDEASKP